MSQVVTRISCLHCFAVLDFVSGSQVSGLLSDSPLGVAFLDNLPPAACRTEKRAAKAAVFLIFWFGDHFLRLRSREADRSGSLFKSCPALFGGQDIELLINLSQDQSLALEFLCFSGRFFDRPYSSWLRHMRVIIFPFVSSGLENLLGEDAKCISELLQRAKLYGNSATPKGRSQPPRLPKSPPRKRSRNSPPRPRP